MVWTYWEWTYYWWRLICDWVVLLCWYTWLEVYERSSSWFEWKEGSSGIRSTEPLCRRLSTCSSTFWSQVQTTHTWCSIAWVAYNSCWLDHRITSDVTWYVCHSHRKRYNTPSAFSSAGKLQYSRLVLSRIPHLPPWSSNEANPIEKECHLSIALLLSCASSAQIQWQYTQT